MVIAVTIGFYSYAATRQQDEKDPRYKLQAVFLSSNGLHVEADVRLAGVKVGRVSFIRLDPAKFVTYVGFDVDEQYRLPIDTSLGIGSSGFTSSNALLVTPGHSDRMLQPGATIRSTHEMPSLEETVSQYIFGGGGLGSGSSR
jgi:phospholipid/cholesterol/gamma-HCH transport system substrate-binding protein